MHEDLLLHYAQQGTPPRTRVRSFVLHDPRLRWVKDVFAADAHAEVTLGGSVLRHVLFGTTVPHVHAHVTGITPRILRRTLAPHGDVTPESDAVITFAPHTLPDASVTIATVPVGREDVTVDSLRYHLRQDSLEDRTGRGLSDITARRLRVHGYPLRVFAEDPLRMLRALRTAAEHRLRVDDETWYALTRSLPRLARVTRDDNGAARFAHPRCVLGGSVLEILHAEPQYGTALIDASGLGALLMPASSTKTWAETRSGMQVLVDKRTMDDYGIHAHNPATLLAGLFAFQPNSVTHANTFLRMYGLGQFPPQHPLHTNPADVTWLLGNIRMFDDVDPASMQPSTFEKIFGSARGRGLLALMRAVFLTEDRHHVARERLHVAGRLLDDLGAHMTAPPKLLRGRDLAILGISPGPLYRTLLSRVRDGQLSGTIETRDDALNLVRHTLARL